MNRQSEMSRKEKKKLKKQQLREAKRRKMRKQAFLRWSAFSVGGILLIVLGYFIFFYDLAETPAGTLRVATAQYNFGVVYVNGGVVDTEIPLVNIGEDDLTITALDSSCGCTTASIINDGVEGPIFGMASHGRNPRNWHTVINPGEQAILKVYYNPAVHPNLHGPVTRIVTIYSDDPENPKQEVRIKVYQSG